MLTTNHAISKRLKISYHQRQLNKLGNSGFIILQLIQVVLPHGFYATTNDFNWVNMHACVHTRTYMHVA